MVDAFNVDVVFYVMEPDDPLLQMYQRAFPDLFSDFSRMPMDLQKHIRYPVGLFSSQTDMYLRYYITDPQVFFNQAQQWSIPSETRFGKRGFKLVRPT